jgi:hypothetical protein
MAVAMEARGFSAVVPCEAGTAEAGTAEAGTAEAGTAEAGTAEAGTAELDTSASRRTWAEAAPWRPSDSLMLALGLAVAGIPMLVSRL